MSIEVEKLDGSTHARCGKASIGNMTCTFPFRALNASEFRILDRLKSPLVKTVCIRVLRLNPIDLRRIGKRQKYYNELIERLSIQKKIKSKGGEFLLIPHLNKTDFKSIERKDDEILTNFLQFQVDAGSAGLVVPDYFKYTSNEYIDYLKWFLKKAEGYGKPIFAGTEPSEQSFRVERRFQGIINSGIRNVLLDLRHESPNEKACTTTFVILKKTHELCQNLWVHSYDVSNRVYRTSCAEQTVLPLLGIDSVSAIQPISIPPKARSKMGPIQPRGFDSSTNGFLTKAEYLQFHSKWECKAHDFCVTESVDTMFQNKMKLKEHNTIDQTLLIEEFYDWTLGGQVKSEMQKREFAKRFVLTNPLLDGRKITEWRL
jgi:hypothetical protein